MVRELMVSNTTRNDKKKNNYRDHGYGTESKCYFKNGHFNNVIKTMKRWEEI